MIHKRKAGLPLEKRREIVGWTFLLPATLLICWMSFWPMIQAFVISLQTGRGAVLRFCGLNNYIRIFNDAVFRQTLLNTFIYLIIQVPVMLLLALIMASVLNLKAYSELRFFCHAQHRLFRIQ